MRLQRAIFACMPRQPCAVSSDSGYTGTNESHIQPHAGRGNSFGSSFLLFSMLGSKDFSSMCVVSNDINWCEEVVGHKMKEEVEANRTCCFKMMVMTAIHAERRTRVSTSATCCFF